MPPLANYRDIDDYVPQYGDFVTWAGFFSTWLGVVYAYDPKHNMLEVIFEGLPLLLVTMPETNYSKNSRPISLDKIRNSSKGTWAVMRHEPNSIVWYI